MLTLFRFTIALALFTSGVVCLYHGLWLTAACLFYGGYQVVRCCEDTV